MQDEARKRLEIYKRGVGTISRVSSAAVLGAFAVFGCLALRNELPDISRSALIGGREIAVALISGVIFVLCGAGLGWLARLPAGVVAGALAPVVAGHAAAHWLGLPMRDVIVAGLFYFLALGALYLMNAPRAVDFLIATESELRKVSWPSRPDLLRQTVVVLTTVAIFTAVILVADVFLSYLMKVIRGL